MSSSLFPKQAPTNNLANAINLIKSIQNPQQFVMNMLQNNPQFQSFFNANKNKSIDQIAQENGLDITELNKYLHR